MSDLRELLDRALPAVMCTTNPDGSPQASLAWFERRGDELVFFAEETSVKVRNLRQDPRVVVLVVDPHQELFPGARAYVRVTGMAQVRGPEPGLEDRLARAYGNPDGYPPPRPAAVASIWVRIERISGFGDTA